MAIKYDKTKGRLREAIDRAIIAKTGNTRNTNTKQKRDGQNTLEAKTMVQTCLDGNIDRVYCRITRQSQRAVDDDNLSGGSKQLRDAITEILGFKGDSDIDGITWEYRQKKGKDKVIIEVFEI